MKKYPAAYVESYIDSDGNVVSVFMYKTHKYEVIDSGWKGGHQPLHEQHKAEQDHIDEMIEKEKKSKNFKEENSEKGLELFWSITE